MTGVAAARHPRRRKAGKRWHAVLSLGEVGVTEPSSAGAALAEQWGMPKLGARPRLSDYLRRLWSRRQFTVELARSRFRAENEQYRLGIAWVVLRPCLNALVYGTVFGFILSGSNSKPQPYVPYMLTGVFVFSFFSGCLSDGS